MKGKNLFVALVTALLVGTFLSCEKLQEVNTNTDDNQDPKLEENIFDTFQPREIIPLTKTQEEIVKQSNGFAINVLREMSSLEGNKNICISPLSASLAISAISCGAEGNTLDQIKKTLGFSNVEGEEMNGYFKYLIPKLQEVDKSVEFTSANAVWLNKGFEIKSTFSSMLDEYYDSNVSTLDFSSISAVNTINNWCKDNTKGLIPEIIGELDENAKLALTNAIYFKGGWTNEFDKNKSFEDVFYLTNGSKQKVTYMHDEDLPIRYGETEDVIMGALPYGNGAYELLICLPKEGNSAEGLLAKLTPALWEEWLSCFTFANLSLDVILPKFKIEYDSQNFMQNALRLIGMTDAFNPMLANFQGISNEKTFISLLTQKTYMEVSEKGIDAAAATLLRVITTALPPSEKPTLPSTFHVDRPFIYAIREISTGATLFMGVKIV